MFKFDQFSINILLILFFIFPLCQLSQPNESNFYTSSDYCSHQAEVKASKEIPHERPDITVVVKRRYHSC